MCIRQLIICCVQHDYTRSRYITWLDTYESYHYDIIMISYLSHISSMYYQYIILHQSLTRVRVTVRDILPYMMRVWPSSYDKLQHKLNSESNFKIKHTFNAVKSTCVPDVTFKGKLEFELVNFLVSWTSFFLNFLDHARVLNRF